LKSRSENEKVDIYANNTVTIHAKCLDCFKEREMKVLIVGIVVIFAVLVLLGLLIGLERVSLIGIAVDSYLSDQAYARKHYRDGMRNYKNGYYEIAVMDFDDALKINADNPDYYAARALAYDKLGESREAISSAEEACEYGKCKVLEKLVKSRAFELGEQSIHYAAMYYTIAIKEDPKNIQAYYKRGLKYYGAFINQISPSANSGRDAVRDFTQTIKLDPNFADAYLVRAKTYAKMDKHSKALEDYTQFIRLRPNDVEGYYERANFYDEIGEHDKANMDFDQAAKLESSIAQAYYNRALTYIKSSSQKAIDICNNAVELYPKDAKVYYYRALLFNEIYYHKNEAFDDFTQAIKLDHAYSEAYYERALIIRDKEPCGYGGRTDEQTGCHRAVADLTQAIKFKPDFIKAYVERADIYRILRDYDKQIKDYTEAIKLSPNDTNLYLERASAYFMLEDYENRRKDIIKACELGDCEEYRRLDW
jgi:tetratricopeptide (TPR) repeat protein